MFDRLIFKGYLSRLFRPGSLRAWLWSQGVPITGFGAYVKTATEELVANAERVAADSGRPNMYVFGPSTGAGPSKDDMARRIAERDGITEGLVCVLRAVEPCTSSSCAAIARVRCMRCRRRGGACTSTSI